MARIPDEVIERLKEEVSLARLVELAGVELRQQGKDLVGLCPFHEERTASLVITPEKNLWHCMGACQAGGSVIDWVMRAEGVSFRHAVELLRDGVAPSALSGPRVTRSTVAKLPSPLPIGAGERELLERVVGFYAQTLKESPEALGVLERRGLDDPGLIEEFRLGYANRTLGYRLPAKNRKPGAELRGKLQELGVFRATGHEHLSGSLVIPVGDARGEVVQLYGRKLRDDLNHRGSSRHLYLSGPRRGVFNAKALACGGELVVCESLIDALTFWRHGLRNVTAAFGADGFTDELHTALKDAGIGRVLIAFDRDEAGDRGAAALADRLGGEGVECFRVLFPAGQDANSFACGVKEPAGALAQLLREAVWIGAGEPAARPAPAPDESEPAGDPPAPAPVEHEQGGARAQLEQHDDTQGEPVQINNTTGTVLYLHHDQQGSTRLLTGSTGKTEGSYSYSAYGTPEHTGTATTPLGYDGEYTSSDTGLIYLRAREYDPATGQFLTRDPLAAISGASYSYAGDNPLNRSDPTGLLPFGIKLPSWEEAGEAVAGWGDTITFGLTKDAREALGDENVNTCSGAYQSGGVAGLVTGALIPGEDDAEAGELGVEGVDEGADVGSTPEGRPFTQHYGLETGPERNIPGSVVDQTINENPGVPGRNGTTVYYDPNNDVTVVTGRNGSIVSARRGEP